MSEEPAYREEPDLEPPQEGSRVWLKGPVMGGVIIIGVGIIFLLQNLGVVLFANWWALFILIPAATSVVSAWEAYRVQRRFSRNVTGPLTTGCLFLFVALVFLCDWPWDAVWPVIIIIVGLGLLLGWRSP